jgi:hypothetical protein
MEVLVGLILALGEALSWIGGAAWVVIQFAWSVLWTLLVGGFWLTLVFLIGTFSVALFRPELHRPRGEVDLEKIRAAIRDGSFDADIARVNARNASRGQV